MSTNLITCILKNFTDLCSVKQKIKVNNIFGKSCLQCFSSEEILIEHKKDCLVINGKQSVKLESGFISFKNYFKQIPAPFKIYADFECVLKKVDIIVCDSDSLYTRNYDDHIPCSFAYKAVCIDNKFSKKVVLYRGKDAVYEFIKSNFSEYNYWKKLIMKHFNKNLVMSAEEEEEEEEKFQSKNICWVCNRLFDAGDNKVRDHCHKNWSCNVNFKMTKKVIRFQNLKGYYSHLVFENLSKFSVKTNVEPTEQEKYMAFTINKNLFFLYSMQFMNSSLDSLIKYLRDKDFKYLSEELSDEFLKLGKQKGVYPYDYMESFKGFSEDKLPDKYDCF